MKAGDLLRVLEISDDRIVLERVEPMTVVAAARRVSRDGRLQIDTTNHYVERDGIEVHLTRLHWLLLECLLEHEGRDSPHGELLTRGWGQWVEGDRKVLRVHISRLRIKLGSQYLLTGNSYGYRLLL